jgi:hypothetical protein
MKTKIKDAVVMAMMVLAGLLAVAGATGCDQTYVPGIGYVNPWLTSAYYGVPSATYHDPTAEIQSVAAYRGAAMENSMAGWDDFINQ